MNLVVNILSSLYLVNCFVGSPLKKFDSVVPIIEIRMQEYQEVYSQILNQK